MSEVSRNYCRGAIGNHWEPLGTIGNHWEPLGCRGARNYCRGARNYCRGTPDDYANTQTSFGRVPAGTRAGCFPSVSAKCKSAENPAGGTSVWTCAAKETWGHQNSILRICDGQNDYSASGQDRFSGDGCRCGATGSRLNAPLAAAEILGKLCTHAADNEKNQISGSYYAQQARDNKHGSFFEGCGFPAPPRRGNPSDA